VQLRCDGWRGLWLLLALVGVKVESLLQLTAKRLGGLGVSDVIKKSDERFVLYVRPFDSDDVILPKPRPPLLSRLFSFTPFPVRIDQDLLIRICLTSLMVIDR